MWYPVIVNQFFKTFDTPVLEDRSFCDRVVANLTAPADSEDVSMYIYDITTAPELLDIFFPNVFWICLFAFCIILDLDVVALKNALT